MPKLRRRPISQAPARGRPATFDRDEALAVALELFWRHGYDGVSVADLTNAMGIAAASLYHAFGSKADLYRQVVRAYSTSGVQVEDIRAAGSSLAAARLLFAKGIAAVSARGKPAGCMISSGLLMTSDANAGLAAELRAMRSATREALARRIEKDIELGTIARDTDANAVARFAMSVLQGISVQALDGASAGELRKVADIALDSWPR
ncbi:MAG TPA: TetR/AcrR family transcriptional regulator [Bradyrhizobium sp.]|nr:TetR/AcrR family transcriptional regulator [Bradyrhizobium sp.]